MPVNRFEQRPLRIWNVFAIVASCGAAILCQAAERPNFVFIQGEGRGGQGGGLFRLLDADRDGKLSAKEIDGAIAVLMKLDRNRDGVLSSEELASAGRGQGGGQRGKGGGQRGGGRDQQRRETQTENNQ